MNEVTLAKETLYPVEKETITGPAKKSNDSVSGEKAVVVKN